MLCHHDLGTGGYQGWADMVDLPIRVAYKCAWQAFSDAQVTVWLRMLFFG
jgi:hypothetical protein